MKTITILAGIIGATAEAVSASPSVTYTEENNVEYYQDTSVNWWVFPSLSAVPPPICSTDARTSIDIDVLTAVVTGENSVFVDATQKMRQVLPLG